VAHGAISERVGYGRVASWPPVEKTTDLGRAAWQCTRARRGARALLSNQRPPKGRLMAVASQNPRCALVHRNGARRCGAALNRASTKIMHRLARRSVRHHAMTMLSLLEAAEQVGKSKSTLWRASKRGELSVTKNEDGQILVDSSELFRVFQANRSEPRVMTQDAAVHVTRACLFKPPRQPNHQRAHERRGSGSAGATGPAL
jgi:hypothetical protein